MKIAIRLLAVLLALIFIGSLAACGGATPDAEEPGEGKETGQETNVPGKESETEKDKYDQWGREIIESPVDVNDINYGKTIVVLTRKEDRDLFSEDRNGEELNDAIYDRNLEACEDLGVQLEFNNFTHDEIMAKVRTEGMTGAHDFSVVSNYAYYSTTTEMAQFYANLNTIHGMHLDAPYWYQNYNASQNINGKQFFCIGSMNTFVIDRTLATFFNSSLVSDLGIGNLYTLTLNGGWTIEKLTEFTENSWQDLNNNGNKDKDDFFGMGSSEGYGGWYTACDIYFVHKDDRGYHELDLDIDRASDAVDMLIRMFKQNDGAFVDSYAGSDIPVDMFVEEQMVFLINNVFRNQTYNSMIRNMSKDYGLIPMPKFDEAQEKYHGWVQDAYQTMSIMENAEDLEMIGTVLDYLQYLSWRDIYPVYTENIIKFKYLRDSESGQCFDLIVDGMVFDVGEVYGFEIGEMAHTMCREIINSGNNSVASTYGKNEQKWAAGLEKIDDFYFG